MDDYNLDNFLDKIKPAEMIDYNVLYKDNPLVLYAIENITKNNKDTESINLNLTKTQLQYLEMLNNTDRSLTDIMKELMISKAQVVIWSKTSPLFKACIDIIKEGQAELLEAVTWNNALSGDSKSSIERMFALKARKPEYRDNAALPAPTLISLRVTLEGQDMDTSASYKTIESGNDV